MACVGLALLGALLPLAGPAARDGAVVSGRVDRTIVTLSGAWLVLVIVGIVFRSADAFGRPVFTLGGGDVVRWMTQLAAGRGMVLTAGCAAVVLGYAVARIRKPEQVPVRVPLVAGLLGVLTPTVTGHASSAPDHQLAVVTAAMYVGATALWAGGLGAMLALVARRRNLLAATLPRFSTIAGFCVVTVALTGVLNAQVRLDSWTALFTTGYGWLVVAKAVCLVCSVGSAASPGDGWSPGAHPCCVGPGWRSP